MDRFIAAQGMHLPAPESHAILFGLAFVAATIVGLFLTWGLRRVAPTLGLTEVPRHRSARRPVAKVGGIGIFLTIALVGPALWFLFGEWSRHTLERGPVLAVLGGAIAMVALGIWDDRDELRPRVKLAFQVLAAAAVWWAGARFGGFAVPGGHIELFAPTSLLVTVFWFVALTNAFNLVDGADGVAGGAALTATLAMFVVSMYLGQTLGAFVLAVIAGAVVGFLFYNFPPATVYLGDAGSLSLGFLLAGVGLVTSSKAATLLAVAIPVVSLGLPLLDTGLAIVRRIIRGESIAARDLGHIHHRLTKLGHSPRKVALLLFGVSALLALASLLLITPDLRLVGIAYTVLGIVAFIGLQRLHVPELLELRRAIARGLRRSSNIGQNVALREALDTMAGMGDAREALEELGRAFEQTDFLEAEIRLVGSSDERESDRVVWKWKRPRGSVAGNGIPETHVIDLATARESRDGRDARSDDGVRGDGQGRATGSQAYAEDVHWEARLPLINETAGRLEGWLTVRRPWGTYLPSELDVLARELLPGVLGGGRKASSAVEPETGGSAAAQRVSGQTGVKTSLRGGASEAGA
jgi:UDP-GlcNAc:undecaprenyl-phosphate GlcNAc-1-phosphate transferase